MLKQVRKSKRPLVLTVNGKAAAIVQDAEAYQRLLDVAARADAREGIRQGLGRRRQGRIQPAREFFSEFESRTWPISLTLQPAPNATLLTFTIRFTPKTPLPHAAGTRVLKEPSWIWKTCHTVGR